MRTAGRGYVPVAAAALATMAWRAGWYDTPLFARIAFASVVLAFAFGACVAFMAVMVGLPLALLAVLSEVFDLVSKRRTGPPRP